MIRIYKYRLDIDDTVEIDLPLGAKILHIDMQVVYPCLWASVDPDAEVRTVSLYVRGTGHPVPDGYPTTIAHLGTLQQDSFVWHVFGPTSLVP